MNNIKANSLIGVIILFFLYGIIGVGTRVNEIKLKAPGEMVKRNWKILRYEGYNYGSFCYHGGKVWYHVANIDNPNIQYRVYITLWNEELQFHYDEPEKLIRAELNNIEIK